MYSLPAFICFPPFTDVPVLVLSEQDLTYRAILPHKPPYRLALDRTSFAGTAMMGPLVILAILTKKPQGWFMILISGIGLFIFVFSEIGIFPKEVGLFRMDLLLMIILAMAGIGNYLFKRI